jgi:hypothetical protein
MTGKQYGQVIAVALMAGLVGGALTGLLGGHPVDAQEQVPRVVTAHEFRLVDLKGQLRMKLSMPTVGLGLAECGGEALRYAGEELTAEELEWSVNIGMTPSPVIELYCPDGRRAASVFFDHGWTAPWLAIFDAQGTGRVGLQLDPPMLAPGEMMEVWDAWGRKLYEGPPEVWQR